MRLRLFVRDLLLASWEADRDRVARVLPPGVAPAAVEGRYLVSVVALRFGGGRLGRLPVAPFSQLNVRTYVSFADEPAVFFARAYVTPLGLGGVFLGAPYRPARLRFRPGALEAPGLGLSLRYRTAGPAEPGELGRHELGLFEAGGLRGFRIRREPAAWERGVPVVEPRVDRLLALGFDLVGEPTLFYTARTAFEADVPPRKLR